MPTGVWIDTTIGHCHLVAFLGAGGMGEVYRATDLRTGGVVAVKLLTAARDNRTLQARFRNEARIHARLAHPHIARMLEFLEHEGTPAIVMEYVDGETLDQRIARGGAIPVDLAARHAVDLLDAVAYLHRRTIIHRDIKSTNVKVSGDGVIKLLDFGIAKGPDSPALTADGSVIGTLQSLAPEQLSGAPADLQTEIWALGVLLFEMVTGHHPFADDGIEGITGRIRAGRYPIPSRLVPGLTRDVDVIIDRCLRVDPRGRYPTCEAMGRDLRQLIGTRSARPAVPGPRLPTWVREAPGRVGSLLSATSRRLGAFGRKRWRLLPGGAIVPVARRNLPLLGSLVAAAIALVFMVDTLSHPTPPARPDSSTGTAVPAAIGRDSGAVETARTRTVTINTINGSAEVWRDGDKVGTTPYRLTAPIGDPVNLVLRRDGYRDEVVHFDVTEGRSEYSYVLRLRAGRPISSGRRSHPFPLLLGLSWFAIPWLRRRASSRVALTPTRDLPAVGVELGAESRVVIGMASDPGCVRDNNEDRVRAVRPAREGADGDGLLAVVCDGMGGHAAGETASRIATEVIARDYPGRDDPGAALVRAIRHANRAVHEAAGQDPALRGMGTTCTAMVLRGGLAWCAHVGDSRCYLVRDGEMFVMTEDHSAVMALVRDGSISRDEARDHPDKNVISRALGSHRDIEVTSWPRPFVIRPGDRFLLSTDGLHDVIREEEILRVVRTGPPHEACLELVRLAREHGAPDNVSVIVLALPDGDGPRPRDTRPMPALP